MDVVITGRLPRKLKKRLKKLGTFMYVKPNLKKTRITLYNKRRKEFMIQHVN